MKPKAAHSKKAQAEVGQGVPLEAGTGVGGGGAVQPEEDDGEVGDGVVELGEVGGVGVVLLAPREGRARSGGEARGRA
jgi:hypothetical protein